MKTYAICEIKRGDDSIVWEAHEYGVWFKVRGPTPGSYVGGTFTGESAKNCKECLIRFKGPQSHKIIELVKV